MYHFSDMPGCPNDRHCLKHHASINNPYELIDILYHLPDFNNKSITELHHSYRNHTDYLVAYNATQALGLPIDEVVERFRDKEE